MLDKSLMIIFALWCGYLIWSGNKACLTGHDIDAKIQQSFLTQPQTQERKTP